MYRVANRAIPEYRPPLPPRLGGVGEDERVRIGLYEATPVYVGSERPIELAEAIASRAPDVDRAEPLPL